MAHASGLQARAGQLSCNLLTCSCWLPVNLHQTCSIQTHRTKMHVSTSSNTSICSSARRTTVCQSSAQDWDGSSRPSRGKGRSGPSRRGDSPPRREESDRRSGGSVSTRNRARRAAPPASDDFVVIGKADSGTYIQSSTDLEAKEGGTFWASAIADEDEEDEGEDDDELLEDEGEEGENELEVEEMTGLLRDLAESLDDTEGESSDQKIWREIYTSRAVPEPYLGPVAIKNAAGKGRGLFTTAAAKAGDLLLVASPLAILYCEEGTTPEIEDLAAHLSAAVAATTGSGTSSTAAAAAAPLAAWQQHALLQLRSAGPAAAAAGDVLPDLLHLLGDPAAVAAGMMRQRAAAAAGSIDQEQQQQQQQHVPPLPSAPSVLPAAEDVLKLVFANCTGEESDDTALVLLRGSNSSGHLGVWPAAAMINHSCCPNTHSLLVGDKLVVRAAEDVPAGHELSISYLGPQLFAPAAVRQEDLQQQWGFKCNCNRCKAEARYAGGSSTGSSSSSSAISDLLMQTYNTCQTLSGDLDAAIDDEEIQTIRQIQHQLLALQQQIEGGIRTAKPPANVRRWLQASAYDLYDLLSLCADQLPAPVPPSSKKGGRSSYNKGSNKQQAAAAAAAVETEALAVCARTLGAVAAGSSAHVDLATEYMVRTEARFGEGHQEAADAVRMCTAAYTARYGQCSPGMMQLLIDTRAGAALL